VRAANKYLDIDRELYYWRSISKMKVDLIWGRKAAFEIKSTQLVQEKHCKGLKALREENLVSDYYIISRDPKERGMKINSFSVERKNENEKNYIKFNNSNESYNWILQ